MIHKEATQVALPTASESVALPDVKEEASVVTWCERDRNTGGSTNCG